ncbi:P-loop containing nucleoside triphosphate hydrolase protein [Globomyces pollinis-pini]|nr:P-loop containing nucleoside triphosphate hydrolase protein [Globomyces pollinis-pini]
MEPPHKEDLIKTYKRQSTRSLKIYPAVSEDMQPPQEVVQQSQNNQQGKELPNQNVVLSIEDDETRDRLPSLYMKKYNSASQIVPKPSHKSNITGSDTNIETKKIDSEVGASGSDGTFRERQGSSQSIRLYNSRGSFNKFDQLSFAFMNQIIKDGNHKDILLDEYPPIENLDESAHLGNLLLYYWDAQVKQIESAKGKKNSKKSKKPTLYRSLYKLFGVNFKIASLPYILESIIKISQSYIFGLLITWLQSKTTTDKTKGYIYAGTLCGLVLCQSFLNQYKFFLTTRIGMQARISLVSAIFTKSFRLSASNAFSTAQITSLITSDVQKFEDASGFIHYLWLGPLETLVITYFVYQQIGIAAFVAIGSLLALIPIQAAFASRISSLRKKYNVHRDERIKTFSDMIYGMIIVKMYAWEGPFCEMIKSIRGKEMNAVQKTSMMKAMNDALFFSSSAFISMCTFTSFYFLGGAFTPTAVFVTTTYLQTARYTMTNLFSKGYQSLTECQLATSRIEKLFLLPEMTIKAVETGPDAAIANLNDPRLTIYIKGASFSLKPEIRNKNDEKITEKDDHHYVLKNIDLVVRKGELVGVCGSVGSGKTSLLNAILGEIHLVQGVMGLRSHNIAYVSQSSWLLPSTLKENILFGRPYREEWFGEVVKACGLDSDFAQFPLKENTMVTERGSNLSGGQKSRLSLARAVYADADIYLLDDPLSAVDAKVAKHLFNYCFRGVLKKKTIILVTHLIPFIQKCDQTVLLDGGRMTQGEFDSIIQNSVSRFGNSLRVFSMTSLTSNPSKENIQQYNDNEVTESQEFRLSLFKRKTVKEKSTANLYDPGVVENSGTKNISSKSYFNYFRAGTHSFFLFLVVLMIILGQAMSVSTDWCLATWSKASIADQTAFIYPALFIGAAVGTLLIAIGRAICFYLLCVRSASTLFEDMTKRIFKAPAQFFKDTPLGGIANRFSKDANLVDDVLPSTIFDLVQRSFMILGTLTVAAIVIPHVLLIVPFVLAAFLYLRKQYIKSARQMKRLDAASRSPIYSFFGISLEGKSTIHAFGASSRFIQEAHRLQNDNTRIYFSYSCAGRWLGVRLDVLAATFFSIVTIATIVIYDFAGLSPSWVGLVISYVLQLVGTLQWTVRQSAEVENLMISVERIQEYTNLPEETPESLPNNKLDFRWPQKGLIQFNQLSMKYPGSDKLILKNISTTIPAGSKIGIVGRTGAGKSSIINALFRLSEPTLPSSITIDDIKTSGLNLFDLRSRLAIIPQEPLCFKGTIRFNLDPFGKCTDEFLWEILERVELKDIVKDMDGELDCPLDEGGCNFSVGERQLVCLARALLKHSKVVVMDEATSAIDIRTDQIIQDIIDGSMGQTTVITIAHRLRTIIKYDKILVLENGEVVETGSPKELLAKDRQQPGCWFARMAYELGDEEFSMLQGMAK